MSYPNCQKQTLGQKLRFLRLSRQYTQEQISRCLNMERAAYANYENDRRIPTFPYIVSISNFYDIYIDFLIRDDCSDVSRRHRSETEPLLTDFYMLNPVFRKMVLEFVHYLLLKQKTTEMQDASLRKDASSFSDASKLFRPF
ncbi:MAG: helix-turn-helix transcriptional regulator [Eubacteriales bacterium]|nr:helix-turn-helix transcriptional regulator [Eubacteriales bacterium]